jgi:hypothetical protein
MRRLGWGLAGTGLWLLAAALFVGAVVETSRAVSVIAWALSVLCAGLGSGAWKEASSDAV